MHNAETLFKKTYCCSMADAEKTHIENVDDINKYFENEASAKKLYKSYN